MCLGKGLFHAGGQICRACVFPAVVPFILTGIVLVYGRIHVAAVTSAVSWLRLGQHCLRGAEYVDNLAAVVARISPSHEVLGI
jgi:hypothetical protein